ncbi:MAG: hypothetical protein WAZ96_02055, partial [Candidatus Moraniibacteriota bacterium]
MDEKDSRYPLKNQEAPLWVLFVFKLQLFPSRNRIIYIIIKNKYMNRIIHFEVQADDVARAKKFYEKA